MNGSSRMPAGLTLALVVLGFISMGRAQGPTIEPTAPGISPGSGESLLGPSPGALPESVLGSPSQSPLSGRAGASVPRVPQAATRPRPTMLPGETPAIAPPPVLPASELPVYGLLDLPRGPEDAGPADGLTLDQAIERLVRANLTLRAQFYEIPQAQADILTASLRANPVFYADTQLVPYGEYSDQRPGGPTQYDVNVSIPLDLSHKRQARMNVAGHARLVLEAQYRNAVRLQIDNLYTTYVDGLAARETLRFAQASLEGLEQILIPVERRFEQKVITQADVNRVRIQRDFALVGVADAEQNLASTRLALGELLNLSATETVSLQLRGSINETATLTDSGEPLVALALSCRPDLTAFRLGIERARAEVKLAEANKWSDVYWLVQPYTFQDGTPYGTKSSTSWAMGVTVPLPLSNRNQGNIQRARLNVSQTRTELEAQERAVAREVRQAEQEFLATRNAIERLRAELLPAAEQVLETARLNFEKGQIDAIAYLSARREFNDVVRQYRDLLVRYRRSMLRLNTAVGHRVLP